MVRRTKANSILGGALLCAITAQAHAENATSTAVNVEGVNSYPVSCFPPNSNLFNSIADVNGFKSGMTMSGSSFTAGFTFTDSSVWATDFKESTDSTYFDKPNTAISYFTGHGVCVTGGNTPHPCTSGSQCNAPPWPTSFPSFCNRAPGDNFGTCAYTNYTRELTTGECTHGGPDVVYSTSVSWGESNYSGSWGGAGTDGGTNLVVVHASCAELSNRGHEVWPAMKGVHLLSTTMEHTGDVTNTSDRGANFAARYRANAAGSVSQAWADALASSSHYDPNSCTNAAGTVVYGGGKGFHGCGAQVTSALGATSTEAYSLINENWTQLRDNTRDAKGNSGWASRWTCNFDCNTWPFYI